jgi:hypothetical protein
MVPRPTGFARQVRVPIEIIGAPAAVDHAVETVHWGAAMKSKDPNK